MAGLFKLGKMTLGSLFSKPVTEQYPFVEHPYTPATRGHVVNDVSRCIMCGICVRGCPAGCLNVDKKEYTWSIDRYQCVQCKHCVLSCPVGCLSMDAAYTPSSTEKHVDVYGLTPAQREAREAEARAKAERQAKAREAALAKKKAQTAAAAKKDAPAAEKGGPADAGAKKGEPPAAGGKKKDRDAEAGADEAGAGTGE